MGSRAGSARRHSGCGDYCASDENCLAWVGPLLARLEAADEVTVTIYVDQRPTVVIAFPVREVGVELLRTTVTSEGEKDWQQDDDVEDEDREDRAAGDVQSRVVVAVEHRARTGEKWAAVKEGGVSRVPRVRPAQLMCDRYTQLRRRGSLANLEQWSIAVTVDFSHNEHVSQRLKQSLVTEARARRQHVYHAEFRVRDGEHREVQLDFSARNKTMTCPRSLRSYSCAARWKKEKTQTTAYEHQLLLSPRRMMMTTSIWRPWEQQ